MNSLQILDKNVATGIPNLIELWLKAERDGVQFPVPLHEFWWIAGHKNKQDAFKLAESLLDLGFDYLGSTLKNKPGRGRGAKAMHLTLAGLEHICMAAHTEQGKQVRELYRISKRNWDELKRRSPAIAQEIELERLRNEGRSLEAQKSQVELQLVQFRHIVTSTMPEPVQQKILGYTLIEKVETRDRIFHDEDMINDGSTTSKTELCHRYGLLTRNGKPDYKRLNLILSNFPDEAFSPAVRIQDVQEFKRGWLAKLDRVVLEGDRSLYLGES